MNSSALFDDQGTLSQLDLDSAIEQSKALLEQLNEQLHQHFDQGVSASALIHERARVIDSLLCQLWELQTWPAGELALVAVGGYGRGELHPHSDIDLLIILGDNCEHCHDTVSQYLTLLWDIGLEIGHSVRTVNECIDNAREDLTVLTNLMEARLLHGHSALLQQVEQAISSAHMWPSREFFRAKLEEQDVRHAKFADTEYNLEPNVKGSPGGLRDLQVIGWIAQRHFGVNTLEELSREEFLNPEEMEIYTQGREFMWKVRYALHMSADREEDRLLFDHQRELAALWGFEDGDKLAVEQFMQTYYRWALALAMLNEVLIQNFDQAILRDEGGDEVIEINGRFQIRNGYIEARNDEVFALTPSALLEVFLLSARNDSIVGISAPTIRLINNHGHLIDDAFRASEQNRRLFMDILRSPYKLTRQLKRMTRYGILGRYLPEWGKIVGQMQHDLFHAYTVDAHTLEVFENIRRFQIPEFEEQFPVTARVANRLPKIELLYVAALYHDIGKGRGGDHSELGAVDAQRFCENHGLSQRDTNLVVWLVKNHLVMSAVAQRKDISDPEVIQQFAQHVGDQQRLDYLLTLTVADINGTNPKLWNAWRGSLLRQLYTETKRALRRGLENPVDKQVWIDETRNAAIDILEYRGFTIEELDTLWRERGEDYFLRERAEDIAWHTEAVAGHHDRDNPLVLVRNSQDSSVANATQIFIHARSRAQLFSAVCAELEQLDLSVHDARIYNANDGMSLDTFFVLDSSGSAIEDDSERLRHIKDQLANRLTQSQGADGYEVYRRTPRQMKSFTLPTETHMAVDDIKQVSVLEVTASDRPGLLARIGSVFEQFDVELQAAKIQTLGERVEDVFFLTDTHNQPILDAQLSQKIQDMIRTELDCTIEP